MRRCSRPLRIRNRRRTMLRFNINHANPTVSINATMAAMMDRCRVSRICAKNGRG